MLELLLVPPLPGGIEGTEYLGEQLAVFGNVFKITAAAQKQLLLEPTFDMTVGTFHDPVLMGYSPVVTAGGKAAVAAKGLVAGGDIKGMPPVAGRRFDCVSEAILLWGRLVCVCVCGGFGPCTVECLPLAYAAPYPPLVAVLSIVR